MAGSVEPNFGACEKFSFSYVKFPTSCQHVIHVIIQTWRIHHIIAQNLLRPNTAAGIPLAIAGTRAPVVAVDSRLSIRCRHRWKTIFAVRCWGLVEIEKCNKFTKQCQLLPDKLGPHESWVDNG